MESKWRIFEKVPPTGQDTVPTEFLQHTFGEFESKEEAERKLAELKKRPEHENRDLFVRQWPA